MNWLDQVPASEIEATIRWLPTHRGRDGFAWGEQIRSATKLREKYPQLDVARKANGAGRRVNEKPQQSGTRGDDLTGLGDILKEL